MALAHGKNSTSTFPLQVLGKGIMNGVLETVSINAYPRQRIDYSSTTRAIYVGYNRAASATAGASNWIIIKRHYNANGLVDEHQILTGSWTGRAALLWDI